MGEHIINAFSILSLFGKPTNELLALLFWQNIVSQYHKQIILDATGQKFYIKRTQKYDSLEIYNPRKYHTNGIHIKTIEFITPLK